jgi:hypothetical protein
MNQFDKENYIKDLEKLIQTNNQWLLKRMIKIFQSYDRRVPIGDTEIVLQEELNRIQQGEYIIKTSTTDHYCSSTNKETSIIMYNISTTLHNHLKENDFYTITKQCNITAEKMNMYLNCECLPTIQELIAMAQYLHISIDEFIGYNQN